jgi:hypothetical protein
MPHSPSHMEKEGEVSRSLKTIVLKGITITNLTKKNPTHLPHLRRWAG